MARILIGWELGANRGHIVSILRYRDALVAAGHDVSLALQRIDSHAGEGRTLDCAVWQAPLWPGLIGSVGGAMLPPMTLGDIVARVGLARDGALGAMIAAWDSILAADRPDMIIADYAPALLCAARDRVPSISSGTGFTMPPPHMSSFPCLADGEPSYPEAELLRRANAELARGGRPPAAALPALFAADREVVSAIGELDPYRQWRKTSLSTRDIPLPLPPIADGSGDELFVYWPEHRMISTALWDGLRRSGAPVRVYVPDLGATDAAMLEGLGFAVERKAMGWDRIRARSRMLLSHGGSGFVTMGMLVGLPQIVLHYDLEKGGNGKAVERLGFGVQAPAIGLDASLVAALVTGVWQDAAIGTHCRATAVQLRADIGMPAAQAVVEAVESLLGG